jgi:NAD(P)-dependent dehydrogenase (short-subunit alcohol dehydrogenase family)
MIARRLRDAPDRGRPAASLTGCRVIVTGASSGLGAGTVRLLAGHGASVLAAARRVDRLASLVGELRDVPGRVVACQADVTVDADARAMVAAAVDAFGGIDVLVNNAGSEVQGPIDSLAEGDFEGMLRANVTSVFLCTRAALPELRRSRGAVINLGSTAVTRPPRARFGYVASKGAVEAMSRALALDLGRDGIRVNVIRPGIIPSELRGLTEEAERAKFATGTTFGKQTLSSVGDPIDVAEAIAWLCGDGGRWVTGAVVDVDGGYVLGAADAI